jgi:hypothetical protein
MNSQLVSTIGKERVRINVCTKVQVALGGVMNSIALTYIHTWFNRMRQTLRPYEVE